MPRPPSSKAFQSRCRRCFSYLEVEFSFRKLPPGASANPFAVTYTRHDYSIIIEGISFGTGLNLLFQQGTSPSIGFGHLLALRAPATLAVCTSAEGQLKQIEEYANALRSHAADLLAGDLAALKEAGEEQQRAIREYQEQERRLRQQERRLRQRQAKQLRRAGKESHP
jgi:hypothetical protein